MKVFKEKEIKRQKTFGRGIQVVFILAIILAMYFSVTQVPIVPVMKNGKIIGWKDFEMTAVAGHNAITAGQSGFEVIAIYKHHAGTYAQIVSYYSVNMTINAGNASTYGNTWQNNSSNMSSIPYSPTAFDILVKFRWNSTHAKSTSNNTWMLQWVRLNISCPELHIHNWATGGTYQNMTKINITGLTLTGTYFWTNFVMNNNGSGYTINKGENVSHCYFQPSAYY